MVNWGKICLLKGESCFSDGPRQRRTVCNIPLFFIFFIFFIFSIFFIFFIRPLTDWFRQTLFYSHWSTQTECSTHSRSTQTPTKLSAPLYTCTDSLYVHVLHMKPCPCCLQLTNKHVNLISDENILVVVFVLVYMPWSPCCCYVSDWWRLDWDQQHAQ